MNWHMFRNISVVVGLCLASYAAAQVPAPPPPPPPGQGFDSGSNFNTGQGTNNNRLQPADSQTRARTHTELAAEYYRQGNYAVALEEIRVALEAESNYVPAFSVRGLVHLALREFDKAERELKRALDLAPKDPAVINNYGWYLCQSGKERQSISYFLDAVKHPLYPTPELAYYNAGVCAMRAGDYVGAENYLVQAMRLSKDGGFGPKVQLAELSYKQGQFPAAKRQLQDLMRQLDVPSAEIAWLALRTNRKVGDRAGEGDMAAILRNRFPDSKEYQEFLKGNFE